MTLNTAIRGEQIEDTSISGAHIIDGVVTEPKLDISNAATDGYVLSWNDSSSKFEWTSLGISVINETPSGTLNGSNTNFTLAYTPQTGTEEVHLNGLLQESGAGNDYTISGSTITFITAPESGDILLASYLRNDGFGGGLYLENVVEDTTPQLGGDLDLNGNNIDYTAILTSNGTYEGEIMTVTVDDASAAFGNALYCASDGNYDRADASASGTMPCRVLALESGSGSKKVLHKGQICDTSWDWTPGPDVYVSLTTGALTQTAPSSTGEQVQIIGYALSADTLFFNPQYALIEIA